ncbi:NrfD/PsrC family molybdoenzyme membrane anchor subunit [Tautonia plasticadhaerens]|uniref:Polysulfide reductase, NrfD n=1 Tax=Tautonia plasticadhaerens TaxID=2527974 RepID=A0A518H8E8_9BACT|nr:NrfD/PsrC family molybdoenzyme membrane anchor subunit [Tautonia plasticadhaerens]QDV37104.1 Polysulfide reductase, NrfD [Tautonia plasticadhaerens]
MANEKNERESGGTQVAPIIGPGHDFTSVTDKISDVVLTKGFKKQWLIGFAASFGLLQLFLVSVVWLLANGTGIWGLNVPVMWGFAIINFVWWIGIGHAGTLISAILLLLRQDWRTSINRFAEAMTLFAVACAGMYPILHLGRPWVFYWLMPYPNTMALWPQFRSPLVFDVFAVSTYATVSLLFWYIGLIPDLGTLRDKAKHRVAKVLYGIGAMGWRGSARHWSRYQTAYLLLAGLATPLVVSVHTIVSYDFAVGIVPGWHTTIFPPYFVAGAVFAGFAMVLTLAIPMRAVYGMQDFITDRHLDNMAKVMLTTGLIVAYGYLMEDFIAWYGENEYEHFMILRNRPFGPYRVYYWGLIACNIVIPQLLWVRFCRKNVIVLWLISMAINVGMWLERFIIVVTSLSSDFVPAAWEHYTPTVWDWSLYLGTIGVFLSLMFLFVRVLPAISITEMKELVHEVQHREGHGQGRGNEHGNGDSSHA